MDIVDLRVPSLGRTGFVDFSQVGGVAPLDVEAGTGDAGIVLSLLLVVSADVVPGTALAELGGGRALVLRVAPEAVDDLVAVVLGFSVVLVEFVAPLRVDRGSFSAAEAPPIVERRSEVEADLVTGDFVTVDGARETRFAVPEVIGLLFSVPGLAGAFFDSSMELVDGRDIWPALEAVAALTPTAGRVEVAIGLAGGLLSPPPGAGRVAVVVLVEGLDAAAAGRLAAIAVVVVGRLGGTPFLRGEAGVGLLSSLALTVVGLPPPDRTSLEVSSAGGEPTGVSVSIDAMIVWTCCKRYSQSNCSGPGSCSSCQVYTIPLTIRRLL